MHVGASARPNEFRGSERFDVLSPLGSGGMGAVYKVFDRELQTIVALKTLRGSSPGSLFRFKQEFRALCDVSHPNLVPLYELLVVEDQWMFTMELVEGSNILTFLRPGTVGEHEADTMPAPSGAAQATSPSVIVEPAPVEVCRRVFRQLAEGVHFLHQSGKLHRDIKPSNVLVTPSERVVVLDFGLVTGMASPHTPMPTNYVLGTPGYVAPEVLRLETLTPAADWYSVGAVLYEVLTGRVPYDGKPSGTLKVPREVVPTADPELSQLACLLLDPDPSRRPRGDQILERLGVAHSRVHAPGPVEDSHFVGRTSELRQLEAALAASRVANPQTVFITGPSGIGKSTLVDNFAMRARASGAIAVSGRCYERESVPLKTLDSLIDSLTAQLLALDRMERMDVLPRDIMLLGRLFPVLRRIGTDTDTGTEPVRRDPQEQRRRGLAALRELLVAIGRRSPLLLVIDDFQWSDVESAVLLDDILGPPDPPNHLLVVCYRSGSATPSQPIECIRSGRIAMGCTDIALDVLDNDDARELARACLPDDAPDHDAESIVREAQGIPFFVQELVHHKRVVHSASVGRTRLDNVLHTRIASLPDEARRVLEVAAVAGYPIAQSLALEAAKAVNGPTTLGVLRAEHMIRTDGSRSDDALVTYHDRIRTAVLDLIAPESSRRINERIARSLEQRPDADPEMLASHLMKADERGSAAVQAVKAADRAAELLAFDRAVFYYRLALAVTPQERTVELALRRRLAEALANAGHGADAADEYLRTAAGLTGDERPRLQQHAAEQLIRCGHLEQGLTTIAQLFNELGLWLPRSRFGLLLSLADRRLRLWLRGYRVGSEIDDPKLRRLIDLYQSLCYALTFNDPMRGVELHSRALLLALRLGEPTRLLRGFVTEALLMASLGGNSDEDPKVRHLFAESERLRTTRDPDPVLEALVAASACGIAFFNGRWTQTLELSDRGSQILQECPGQWFELAQFQIVGISALYWLGDIDQLCRRTFACLQDAKAKGDRFKASGLRGGLTNFAWLALDQPGEARRHANDARAELHEEFDLQHSYNVFAQAQIDLYAGDAVAALRRIEESWGKTRRALLLTVQMNRINLRHVRARAALMAAQAGSDRNANLAIARRDARRIRSERMAWSTPLALLLEAGIAACRGQPESALAAAQAAEVGFTELDMHLFALVARRRQGQLLGDANLMREADESLVARGIRNPDRCSALFAPGF